MDEAAVEAPALDELGGVACEYAPGDGYDCSGQSLVHIFVLGHLSVTALGHTHLLASGHHFLFLGRSLFLFHHGSLLFLLEGVADTGAEDALGDLLKELDDGGVADLAIVDSSVGVSQVVLALGQLVG